MARGNKNHSNGGAVRGTPRGGGGQFRGRGRGYGRGRGRGRGRGGGGNPDLLDIIDFQVQKWPEEQPAYNNGASSGYNSPRGRGRGWNGNGNGYSNPRSGFASPQRGASTSRGRGRGGRGGARGDYANASQYSNGRGREARLRAGGPLSRLLDEDRPLLRPVKFVRSVHTATLFQQQEDIFQPVGEEPANDEQSHVPTADRVARVFGARADEDEASSDDGYLEEIDFADVGRVQAEVDARATVEQENKPDLTTVEEKFTGFYIDTKPTPVSSTSDAVPVERMTGILGESFDDDEEVIVYVAPHPRAGPVTPPPELPAPMPSTSVITGLMHAIPNGAQEAQPILPKSPTLETLEQPMADVIAAETVPSAMLPPVILADETPMLEAEDVSSLGAPAEPMAIPPPDVEMPSQESASVDAMPVEVPVAATGASVSADVPSASNVPEQVPSASTSLDAPASAPPTAPGNGISDIPVPPAFNSVTFSFDNTPRKKYTRRVHPVSTPRSLINKTRRRKAPRSFSSFGARLSEAHLQEGREKDPRRNEQRRGDSDVDWGDGSDGGDAIEEVSSGIGAMDLDGELDVKAMTSFVKSMSADGSRFVTMDDIADMERMRAEKEEENEEAESESESSDEEVEEVVRAEERALMAEGGVMDGLERPGEQDEESSEESEESSSDEEIEGGSFQARLARLRAAQKGKGRAKDQDLEDESDFDMSLEKSWADRDEDYFAHMQDLLDSNANMLSRKQKKQLFNAIHNGDWHRDEFEQMTQAFNHEDEELPAHLREQWEKDRAKKAENKRQRREALLAEAADPLARKKGGKKARKAMLAAARLDSSVELANRVVDFMSLEKQIRRFLADTSGKTTMALPPCDAHTRAKIHKLANAFNLKSVSKGKGEGRYTSLIKTSRSGMDIKEGKIRRILKGVSGTWNGPANGDRRKAMSLAKHREGEEVGKAAPKIGETNIGYQMLSAMGWAEGDRIGLSGGLAAPLTAVMKKTKLGLGATM